MEFCAWCDHDLMAQYLREQGTEMHVKVALACFKQKDTEVYRLALDKLEGHEISIKRFCADKGCVYSMSKPGTVARARAASELCTWCDGDFLE